MARVPARLDVMGGIADYSGANVCEAVLGRGVLIALQARTDRTLRIRTMQVGHRTLPVETRMPLDYFASGGALADYAQVRALCHSNPLVNWVAYIGGSIFTLLKEESVTLPYGFSLLLLSAVPMNVGIGSSAAVEIGTLCCLNAYLGAGISPARLARLGQMAENHVVGAPCGIMDQITDHQRARGPAHAHSLPARRGARRGRDSSRHRLRRHQLDGPAFGRGQSLHRHAHRRVHGQANHQRDPRAHGSRGARLPDRALGRGISLAIRG